MASFIPYPLYIIKLIVSLIASKKGGTVEFEVVAILFGSEMINLGLLLIFILIHPILN